MAATTFTAFLLSPANLGGRRAAIVLNPRADFPLARLLHSSEGAPLGEVFSFVSGLYFRGKVHYSERFGSLPGGVGGGLVMSPAEGLRFLHERVTATRLREWAKVAVDARNPAFTEDLVGHCHELLRTLGDGARYVLLGSVATDKYVEPLTQVFRERLLFPRDFVGRGDMSRGALMLQAARSGVELEYAPVAGSALHGRRAPGVSKGA
ncbi:MAG TPA: hypothetical protein VM686_22515 [Polyangiaceae bacterium]|nr:hypothetical protein [Polyangiaceae bacterium]